MWQAFAAAPHPALGALLTELGWPPGRELPAAMAIRVLGAADKGAAPELIEAAVRFARELPIHDETLNDAICSAWARSGSARLEPIALDERRPVDVSGLVAIGQALGAGGRDDTAVAALLRRLDVPGSEDRIEALWTRLALDPSPVLGAVLAKLGWPAGRPVPPTVARGVLGLAVEGADARVLDAVVVLARVLPSDDEAANDVLYGAWVRSQSDELEQLIVEQDRQCANPAFEALIALVTGRLERYSTLGDHDGAFLMQAFALAPEPFRRRLAQTVAASPDRAIKEAYRRALQSGGIEPAQAAENLKLVGDEDGLFEQTRHLSLIEVLSLCERWASIAARPTQPKYGAAVDEAVDIYRELGGLEPEPAPELPEGMMDLFDYWEAEEPDDTVLRADLEEDDPFYQARALYLGQKRGLVDADRIARAARSADWPARLVGRLLDPQAAIQAGEDHVLWVNACAVDGPLLTTVVGDSPEEFDRNMAKLKTGSGPLDPRTEALLRILCAFQRVFVAGGITVDDTAAAVDARAIEVEDAAETSLRSSASRDGPSLARDVSQYSQG